MNIDNFEKIRKFCKKLKKFRKIGKNYEKFEKKWKKFRKNEKICENIGKNKKNFEKNRKDCEKNRKNLPFFSRQNLADSPMKNKPTNYNFFYHFLFFTIFEIIPAQEGSQKGPIW